MLREHFLWPDIRGLLHHPAHRIPAVDGHGASVRIMALVIPNIVALLVGTAVVVVALGLRRRPV
jgi:hypothetical protein